MLPIHPELAPRGRFRGQRRYFRGVHRRAAAFHPDPHPGAWWNFWHYHADWPGWGNRGWRYRREHLPFPYAPGLERVDASPIAAALQALLPDLELELAVGRDEGDYWIWARGVGEPLVA